MLLELILGELFLLLFPFLDLSLLVFLLVGLVVIFLLHFNIHLSLVLPMKELFFGGGDSVDLDLNEASLGPIVLPSPINKIPIAPLVGVFIVHCVIIVASHRVQLNIVVVNIALRDIAVYDLPLRDVVAAVVGREVVVDGPGDLV